MAGKPIQKVFLVVPPTGLYIREDRCQTPIKHMVTVELRPPVDLLYAAAAFQQAGADCRLVDYPGEKKNVADLFADIREFGAEIVVLSITTPGFQKDMEVAARIKESLPAVLLGAKGAHFNTLDVVSLEENPALDFVFRGEFEPACREIAEGKPWGEILGLTFRAPNDPKEVIRNPDRPFVEDLDSIPFPARGLANNSLYRRPDTGEMQTTLVTNRGCPFNCVYCLANQVAGRRNRTRSVENILAEIEECVNQFGIRSFLFRSDLFTARRDWVLDLCREIQKRGLDISWSCNSRVDTLDPEMLVEMKRAGCWIIAFGIESGSQEMLDHIGKKTDLDTAREALGMTRRAGVLSSIYFLVGLPWETPETLRANEKFAREIDPDILEVFYAYPFPGTNLYEQAVRDGLLEPGEIPREAYDRPAMPSLRLSMEELSEARAHALKDFYLQPHVVFRTLLRSRSLREFFNYVRYGWRQLKEFL